MLEQSRLGAWSVKIHFPGWVGGRLRLGDNRQGKQTE